MLFNESFCLEKSLLLLKVAMEKSRLFYVDDFGIKNYNYTFIGMLAFFLFIFLNVTLGYFTYLAEIGAEGSTIDSYSDALWLMLMSASTIGFGDVYPVTLLGRFWVFMMFILGVGILGSVGAVFVNKVFGFADTNIKNRELRHQNEQILNKIIELEQKIEKMGKD